MKRKMKRVCCRINQKISNTGHKFNRIYSIDSVLNIPISTKKREKEHKSACQKQDFYFYEYMIRIFVNDMHTIASLTL
jgi:hypothetical protein